MKAVLRARQQQRKLFRCVWLMSFAVGVLGELGGRDKINWGLASLTVLERGVERGVCGWVWVWECWRRNVGMGICSSQIDRETSDY